MVLGDMESICKTYKSGHKVFLNEFRLLHRENGPAIIWTTGSTAWYQNDKPHREDGPASEFADGRKFWFLKGKQYSEERFNELTQKK